MPWFRVDDNLDQHPKADLAGNRALGLWVRAGSYSARLLTEGFVPTAQVARLGGSRTDAQALVTAGLWEAVSGGYCEVAARRLAQDCLDLGDMS